MRGYKAKMKTLKLSRERQERLYAFCRTATADDAQTIERALDRALGRDALRVYLFRHAVLGWNWAKLQAEGVPCSRDTFRYYRARFFAELDKLIP